MNIVKTRAIVLKEQNFRDSSKILTLYTQQFGKLKVLAKGIKSPKSRMAGNLQQFSLLEVVLYKKEQSDFHLLSQADLIDPLEKVYNDLERLAYGSAVLELVNRLTADDEPHPGLFALLTETLRALETAAEDKLPLQLWSFALKLSANLGYRPNLAGCVDCGKSDYKSEYLLFSPESGGLVCRNCARQQEFYLKLSQKGWELMKKMLELNPNELECISTDKSRIREISEIISSLLEYHAHTRKNLNSLEFLEQLKY
ncbi:MAG: DNA repair protein RecO [candidate division Zixibacteria bacterium]|nr:DNA repair protein RecO [candidate division Zixibacteria bacterium]